MFRQVVLLLVVLVTFSAAASRKRPTNPNLGQDQEKSYNIFTQLFGNSYYTTLSYSEKYRPPSMNDDLKPEPTLVQISLKNLNFQKLNETEGTLIVDTDFIQHYTC